MGVLALEGPSGCLVERKRSKLLLGCAAESWVGWGFKRELRRILFGERNKGGEVPCIEGKGFQLISLMGRKRERIAWWWVLLGHFYAFVYLKL